MSSLRRDGYQNQGFIQSLALDRQELENQFNPKMMLSPNNSVAEMIR